MLSERGSPVSGPGHPLRNRNQREGSEEPGARLPRNPFSRMAEGLGMCPQRPVDGDSEAERHSLGWLLRDWEK